MSLSDEIKYDVLRIVLCLGLIFSMLFHWPQDLYRAFTTMFIAVTLSTALVSLGRHIKAREEAAEAERKNAVLKPRTYAAHFVRPIHLRRDLRCC